jgi:hypothetical protein
VADHVRDGSAALARSDVGLAGQQLGDSRRERGLPAGGSDLGQQLVKPRFVLVGGEGGG